LSATAWHYVAKGRRFLDEDRAFLVVDALGLAIFAVIGASAGAAAGFQTSVVSAVTFLTTLLLRTAAIFLGWSLPKLR